MGTPHPYDAMCVCHDCVAKRHPAHPKAPRALIRDGQAEARKVTRTAFHLVPITVTKTNRELQLSRSGAVYEDKGGTLRRVGTARLAKGQGVAVHEHGMVRGKAERKRLKRARHQAREQLHRALAAQQAKQRAEANP